MKFQSKGFFMMVGFILLALSWLVPNKAYPWLPAWNEGMAFAAVLVLWWGAVAHVRPSRLGPAGIAWPLVATAFLAIVLPWVQFATGLLLFYGDALVITLYFACFLMAVHGGVVMGHSDHQDTWGINIILTIVFSAIISTGMALEQWTKTWDLAVFIMESGSADRPGANLGQINHLNTLCFLGLCGAFFLYSQKKLGILTFAATGYVLGFGMALTQSRTGWLQVAFLCVTLIFLSNSKKIKAMAMLLGGTYFSVYLAIPLLESAALLSAEEHFRSLPVNDVRLTMWSALLHASALRPWGGYGWLQTGWAQQATALDFPILRSYMSYSHNFIIDLIIWCGWPMALLITWLLFIWFFSHLRNKNIGNLVFLYCAIAGIFIHGLLEYPLAYAYFLLPAGLAMGYIDGRLNSLKNITLNFNCQLLAAVSVAGLFVLVSYDYVRAVQTDVAVRMQSSQIGRGGDLVDAHSDFKILNQLAAIYEFRMMQHDEFMDDSKIELMEKVVKRYPYSPALFQYAWARAMRGDYEESEHQLKILCGIYSSGHSRMIRKRWSVLQEKYPDKVGLVKFPEIFDDTIRGEISNKGNENF